MHSGAHAVITTVITTVSCETASRLKENREYHPTALLSINVFHHQSSEETLGLSQVSVVAVRMTKISNSLLNIEEVN